MFNDFYAKKPDSTGLANLIITDLAGVLIAEIPQALRITWDPATNYGGVYGLWFDNCIRHTDHLEFANEDEGLYASDEILSGENPDVEAVQKIDDFEVINHVIDRATLEKINKIAYIGSEFPRRA